MMSERERHIAFGTLLAVALTADAGTSTAARKPAATGTSLATHIAFVRGGNLWVLFEPSGRRIRLTSGGGARSPVWATSGGALLFQRRVAGHDAAFRWRPGAAARRVPAGLWAPNGPAVATAGRGGSGPAIWVRRGRQRVRVVPPEAGFIWTPLAWSPDSSRLVVGRYVAAARPGDPLPVRPATLWLVAAGRGGSGIRRVRLPGRSGWPDDVTWSPDGQWLTVGLGPSMPCVSCRADGRPYYAVPVNGGPVVPLGPALDARVDLSWAPAGRYAVIAQSRGGRETYVARPLERIDTVKGDPRNGAGQLLTNMAGRSDSEPRVAPNGRAVIFTRGLAAARGTAPRRAIATRRIYRAGPTPGAARRISGSSGWTDGAPGWTADGRWVIFVRWRAATAQTEAAAALWAVQPDGRSARRLTVIDLPAGFLNGFGYYGSFDWSRVFAIRG